MRDALAASRTSLPGLGAVLAAKGLGHIGDVTDSPPSTISPATPAAQPAEARRALKRRLSNVVYRIMKRDQRNQLAAAA